MTRTLFLFASMLALSGCIDYSTPKGVVGSAYKALKKNDLKTFRKTFTKEARKQYGTKEAAADLLQRIEGRDLAIGEIKLVDSQQDDRGWDLVRNYTVKISDRAPSDRKDDFELLAHVKCEVYFELRNHGYDWGGAPIGIPVPFPGGGGGGGPTSPYPCFLDDLTPSTVASRNPSPAFYEERTWCRITSL